MRLQCSVAIVLALILSACSSEPSDPIGDGLKRINECEIHADFVTPLIPIQREFAAMQAQIAASGAASLDDNHAKMLRGFSEVMVIDAGRFDPEVLGPIFEAGETTWDELLERGGLRAVASYSSTFSRLYWDDRLAVARRYADELEWECAARDPETIEYLCFEDPQLSIRLEACRAWENIPTRDLEIIAEACEQVPYLVFCDPEDPPSWLPPDS